MNIAWGGRNLGIVFAPGFAVYAKHFKVYIAALIAGLGRDLGDLIAELGKLEPNTGVIIGTTLFMVAGLCSIVWCVKCNRD